MNSTDNQITFTQAYASYLLNLNAQDVSAKHLQNQNPVREAFVLRMGDLTLDAITPDVIRRWLLWLQGKDTDPEVPAPPAGTKSATLSSAGVDRHFRTLRAFFNWCEQEELIHRSPFRKVKRPQVEHRSPDVLTEAEAYHLLDCVRTNGDRNSYRDYCLHLLLLDTGIRLNECYQLNLADVNLQEGFLIIRHGKGKAGAKSRQRNAVLGLECRKALSLYILKHRRAVQGESALFVNEYGYRLAKSSIQHIITKDLKRYVHRDLVRWGPHTHRHTFVTFDLRYSRDIERTRKRAGHSNVKTTQQYGHLVMSDLLYDDGSPVDVILRNRRSAG
jgi:site-specific recombinase XerD